VYAAAGFCSHSAPAKRRSAIGAALSASEPLQRLVPDLGHALQVVALHRGKLLHRHAQARHRLPDIAERLAECRGFAAGVERVWFTVADHACLLAVFGLARPQL